MRPITHFLLLAGPSSVSFAVISNMQAALVEFSAELPNPPVAELPAPPVAELPAPPEAEAC